MTGKFWHRILLTLPLILLFPSISNAGFMLSLDDRGVDLGNLSVGQTVTIDVVLSGLGASDELGYLAATVEFDLGLLGAAFNVNPGAIVPDTSAFVGSGFSGIADGNYDFFFSGSLLTLTTNGVFFSFDVTAQSAGGGAFDFTFLDASDANIDPVVIDSGGPLAFAIHGNGAGAVPEPSSLVIALSGTFIALIFRRRRQTGDRTSS